MERGGDVPPGLVRTSVIVFSAKRLNGCDSFSNPAGKPQT
jgi:hypothetical protein